MEVFVEELNMHSIFGRLDKTPQLLTVQRDGFPCQASDGLCFCHSYINLALMSDCSFLKSSNHLISNQNSSLFIYMCIAEMQLFFVLF